MVMVIVFSVQLGWLPPGGAGPGGSAAWKWDWEHVSYMILPAITMSVIPMGIIARTVRALVADILNQEFVPALRAKGLLDFGVFRHVVKNAAPTALAVMGLQLGYLLGGSILIETVFSWPGTGFLLGNAIFQRDLPLLQGTILVLAMFFVGLNVLVDILQGAEMSAIAQGKAAVIVPPLAKSPGYWSGVWRRFKKDKVAVCAGLVVLAIILMAIFADYLAPADPTRSSMLRRLRPIGTPGYPLGAGAAASRTGS
eukprot:gene56413-77310_t